MEWASLAALAVVFLVAWVSYTPYKRREEEE